MRKLLLGLIAVLSLGNATAAVALPIAPAPAPPIPGVPTPCTTTNPWPAKAPIDKVRKQFEEKFGIRVQGDQWTEQNRRAIKIVWETIDAVSCTDYFPTLLGKNHGRVGFNAAKTRSWAWGDWSLTKAGYVTLDLSKFHTAIDNHDEGRLVRLVIHEFGHAFNSDRHSNPRYWQEFKDLHAREGHFSEYAGGSVTEVFADTVGYYVGRCALENPYNSGKHKKYYEFVKKNVFHGREFGPAPGTTPDCAAPKKGAEEPAPATAEETSTTPWYRELVAE